MPTARLAGSYRHADGTTDTFWGQSVPAERRPLPHHTAGLLYTSTGYGRRIPSPWVVLFNGRWRRVYVCQYSNAGTAYIGRFAPTGERLLVSGIDE